MMLCFGTFVGILSCCTHGMPQLEFVPRVAWVLDRKNSSLEIGLKTVVDDLDGMPGNPHVVSNLLRCERPLVLRDKQQPSLAVACERFKSKVMPHISEDMVAKAVLAVRYLISQDDTIESERKESFKKYLGMYRDEFLQQTSFDVPDFFTKVLLYTTCVDNREGRPYVGMITDTFFEVAADAACVEPKWDTTEQKLELIPTAEKRLSDWVEKLCQLRPTIMEDEEEFLNMEWLGVNMTDLDPGIWGRTEIKVSDA